jgi:hypothetical protein
MQDTVITTKVASIPISMQVAKIAGVPITDIGTYISIFIGCLVIIDYAWKWHRRLKTPLLSQEYLDVLKITKGINND